MCVGPEQLEVMSMPIPSFGSDELLVCVRAASLNPVDFKFLAGSIKFINWLVGIPTCGAYCVPGSLFCLQWLCWRRNIRFLMLLGFDVAGYVVAAGKDCRRFHVGDEVFAMADFTQRGALAEYCVIKEDRCAKKPQHLTYEDAAELSLVSQTSWEALVERCNLKAGQKVLVLGGAGGTGSVAIQMALYCGANVVATTASTRNVSFIYVFLNVLL